MNTASLMWQPHTLGEILVTLLSLKVYELFKLNNITDDSLYLANLDYHNFLSKAVTLRGTVPTL